MIEDTVLHHYCKTIVRDKTANLSSLLSSPTSNWSFKIRIGNNESQVKPVNLREHVKLRGSGTENGDTISKMGEEGGGCNRRADAELFKSDFRFRQGWELLKWIHFRQRGLYYYARQRSYACDAKTNLVLRELILVGQKINCHQTGWHKVMGKISGKIVK